MPAEQLAALCTGLGRQLTPGGVGGPQEVDYPLFTAARQVWRDNQPAHSLCTDAMETAGLQVRPTTRVTCDYSVFMQSSNPDLSAAFRHELSSIEGVQNPANGVMQVEVVEVDYTVRLPKAQWFRMVRARFWSTFSHFTDEQLEKGIAELELLHAVRPLTGWPYRSAARMDANSADRTAPFPP